MDEDLEASKADDRFYVKSLTLENFRCFEKTELGPFDPHFNLLVGTNGSGKSSVLLALANVLRKFAAHELDNGDRPIVRGTDIRFGELVGKDQILRRDYVTPSHILVNLKYQGEIWGDVERLQLSDTLYKSVVPFAKQINDKSPGIPGLEYTPEPLIVNYTTRRNLDAEPLSKSWRDALEFRRVGAFTRWQDARTNSEALQNWCKDQTLFALQAEQREFDANIGIAGARAARQLSLLKEAIRVAVNGARDIEYNGASKDIVVYLNDGGRQPLSRTSDGWKAVIGLVADLVRRACHLNAEFLGAETLERTTGLVLIDEIDLHLHPKWQRRIVGALKEIFPKIQFFATTHSPQVIGEARPEELVLLTKDGQQKRPMASYGMDSNWILECVMEAEGRDPNVAKQVKRLYDSIEDGEFEAARELIKELRQTVGNFGDVEAAESYIWRAEHEADEAAE